MPLDIVVLACRVERSGIEPESNIVPLRVLRCRDTFTPLLARLTLQEIHRVDGNLNTVDVVVVHQRTIARVATGCKVSTPNVAKSVAITASISTALSRRETRKPSPTIFRTVLGI